MADGDAAARRARGSASSQSRGISNWHCAWCDPGSPPEGYTSGICAECLERELAALRHPSQEVSGDGSDERPHGKRRSKAA